MNRSTFRRTTCIFLVVFLLMSTVGSVYAVTPVVKPGITRLGGEDRYGTCIKVAIAVTNTHENKKVDAVVVSSGTGYADALSGSYLAARANAPIFIMNPKGSNTAVLEQISKVLNKDGKIFVLGGTKAIPKAIERKLKGISRNVERLGGDTRYDTNLLILDAGDNFTPSTDASDNSPASSSPDDSKQQAKEPAPTAPRDLLVCSGANYPDALSASGTGKAILLVDKGLTAEQKAYLKKNKSTFKNIYIIGGSVAVSEKIANQVANYGLCKRIEGKDRYRTSIAVARNLYRSSQLQEVVLASGENFPDGLVGGPLAYSKGCPLILTHNKSFMPTYQFLVKRANIKAATILGGASLISDDATGLTKGGAKKKGLLKVGNKLYYSYDDATFAKNKSQKIGGETYYFGSDCAAVKNGIIKEGNQYYYVTNGKKDSSVCKAVTQDGAEWNVINGVATKVVTEKDKTQNRALKVIARITNDKMSKAEKLRACWDYSQSFREFNPRIPHYTGLDWHIVYANDLFVRDGGNCMSFGAAFAFLARGLGYDNVYACNSGGHGWAEINGLVYDPEWAMHHFNYSYYGAPQTGTDQNYRGAISAGAPWMRIKI